MELRRALLLFAIVLGLAALASVLARPSAERDAARDSDGPATSSPGDSAQPAPPVSGTRPRAVRFTVGGPRKTVTVRSGQAVTVSVAVEEPGAVRIDSLGLTSQAEPLAPARFDVFSTTSGRHAVLFTATPDTQPRLLGHLRITSDPEQPAATGSGRRP